VSERKQILDVQHIHMRFTSKGVCVRAVTDVSFTVNEGETIGIVGESGCGKTTLGRCIVRAYEPSEGEVFYTAEDGETVNFTKIDAKTMKKYRKEIQMIFQDPYSSLDPRMTVYDIIKEPLAANFPRMPKSEMDRRIMDIAAKVGLNTSYLMRYPHAFSGGQRQRIGIARALVLNPRVIVCDESVSALDVSIQAQVINLLHDLQKEFALTYLFISHDLSVVEYISDKVGVMYLGKLVEYAPTKALYGHPLHPYTESLLSAVPVADPEAQMERIPLEGEIPNPASPPSGCYFHTRCRYCTQQCKEAAPAYRELEPDHFVACHRAEELKLKGFNYGD
jgi:peptide/nickel transport system ATP-binding protein